MNDIFNFRRFGQMLAVDFKRIVRNYGLTFLILCLAEAIIYFIVLGIGLIMGETVNLDLNIRISIFGFCIIVFILTMPTKCYGFITDRSKGSEYLSLPASSLEKFLSMLLYLNLMFIIFMLATWSVDELLCYCFPNSFTDLNANQTRLTAGMYPITTDMLISVFGLPPYLLGALWFKRGKAGKTFLITMALMLILYVIILLLNNGDVQMAGERLLGMNKTLGIRIITTLTYAALLVLIYLRVKKIQH